MQHDDHRHADDARDRCDAANKIEIELLESEALTAFGTVASRSVYPSGAAFTTASVPMLPPAPARFSTTKDWPSRSASH